MGALNAGKIHKACRAADEGPSGKDQFRHRLPTTRGNRARAVSYPLSPGKGRPHHRMGLEPLKLVERRERRIFVVEMHDESHRNHSIAVMIDERAATRPL